MNMIKKYPVVMSLVLGIVTIVWLGFFQVVDEYSKPIIGRIISSIFLIAIACALGFKSRFRFNSKTLFKGLFLMIAILSMQSIVVVVNSVLTLTGENTSIVPIQTVLQLFLLCVFVAITEEVLCRVIMINAMINKWGNNKKGVTNAIVISSIIFGMLHGMHFFTHQGIPLTIITQIINATFMGLAFAVVYNKYDNLWPCIIFHCLYDFAILNCQLISGGGMITVGASGEMTLGAMLRTITIVTPGIIFTILQIRELRKKLVY